MPRRLGARGAVAGAFGALSDSMALLVRERMQKRGREHGDELQRARTAQEKVNAGEWSPAQAEAFMRGGAIEPSVSERLSESLYKPLTEAPTPQTVPTRAAGAEVMRAKRVPLVGFGKMPQVETLEGDQTPALPSTQYGPVESPEMRKFTDARYAKLRSFPAQKVGSEQQGEGADAQPVDIFGKWNPDTGAMDRVQTMPTGPTAGQSGRAAFATWLQNEGSPARAEATVTSQNIVEKGTRGEKAKTAAAEASARYRAETEALLARYGGVLPEERSAAMQLAGDFATQSKDFYTIERQYQNMVKVSRSPDAPGAEGVKDLALVYSYMKILSPESTVMQGEVASAENTAGVPGRVVNLYNSLLQGAKLNPEQRQAMLAQATNVYQGASVEHKRRVTDFSSRAATLAPNLPATVVIREASPALQQEAAKIEAPIGSVRIVNGVKVKVVEYDKNGQAVVEVVP